jgi:predicted TIM-barrel fold metal-dependent hydrolase
MRRQRTDEAVAFLDAASISPDDKNKIFRQNAERIFGVSPVPTISGVSL